MKCCIAVEYKCTRYDPARERTQRHESATDAFPACFSVLALAGLCVITSARDLAGVEASAVFIAL